MTDGEREALKIKLKNEVINQRTSKGNTFPGDLKARFKAEGLTDAEISEVISAVPLW